MLGGRCKAKHLMSIVAVSPGIKPPHNADQERNRTQRYFIFGRPWLDLNQRQPWCSSLLSYTGILAEPEGFEPSHGYDPSNWLATSPLQPLGYNSEFCLVTCKSLFKLTSRIDLRSFPFTTQHFNSFAFVVTNVSNIFQN